LLKTFKALNGLLCADVPFRNYSLTHLRLHPIVGKLLLIMPTQVRQIWTGWLVTFWDIHTHFYSSHAT